MNNKSLYLPQCRKRHFFTPDLLKSMRTEFAIKMDSFNYNKFVAGIVVCPHSMTTLEHQHLGNGLKALVAVICRDVTGIAGNENAGSFTTLLSQGKLYSAFCHADEVNMKYFYIYLLFIKSQVPEELQPQVLTLI